VDALALIDAPAPKAIRFALAPPAMSPLPPLPHRLTGNDDAALVAALQRGDSDAFETLIDRYHAAMVRVAGLYVRDRQVAQEVVQETWLAVVEGIERFEGRSSLKTWLFRILTNRAKTRAVREGRSLPFSAVAGPDSADEPAVDPDRFLDPNDPQAPGAWASPPRGWETLPEERLLSRETLQRIAGAIEGLPAAQREVIRLRDVEGWDAEEVAAALDITDGNQRVLLHRARSKVRQALEDYLETGR
jgi:RNA polymerase sigma-70 factor (ECF subfamily)